MEEERFPQKSVQFSLRIQTLHEKHQENIPTLVKQK